MTEKQREAGDEEVRQLAEQAALRWREVLDRLAAG